MLMMFHKKIQGPRTRQDGHRINREGFTLVEIMMVLFILTVGILPLAVIQHRARSEVTESDLFTQGITVAQDQLERMKGLGFGIAVADTGEVGNVQWVSSVTNVDFGLDRLEVTVTWQVGNQPSSLTMADLVSIR